METTGDPDVLPMLVESETQSFTDPSTFISLDGPTDQSIYDDHLPSEETFQDSEQFLDPRLAFSPSTADRSEIVSRESMSRESRATWSKSKMGSDHPSILRPLKSDVPSNLYSRVTSSPPPDVEQHFADADDIDGRVNMDGAFASNFGFANNGTIGMLSNLLFSPLFQSSY